MRWLLSVFAVLSWRAQQGRLGIWSWSGPTRDDAVQDTRHSAFVERG